MLHLNFHPFPKINTQRLVLRRLLKKDAAALFAIRNNAEAMRYIDRDPMKKLSEATKLITTVQNNEFENKAILWVISFKEMPEKMIGTICYWRIDPLNYRAEIGYILHPGCWNKGIMHEAIQPVIQYGFTKMNLHSIEAHINPANGASEQILIKNGFIKEGYFKECLFYNGRFLDTVVFSLLKK